MKLTIIYDELESTAFFEKTLNVLFCKNNLLETKKQEVIAWAEEMSGSSGRISETIR